MNKKLFSGAFILIMIGILLAGCSKLKDTNLEGTWRADSYSMSEIIKNLDGEIIEENDEQGTYPLKEIIDGEFVSYVTPYIKMEDGKIGSYNKYHLENVPDALDVPEGDFFIFSGENDYSVEGDKIFLEEGEGATYTITGNKLTIVFEDEIEIWDIIDGEKVNVIIEFTQMTQSIKVPDSEVSEPIDPEDYPDLSELFFWWMM